MSDQEEEEIVYAVRPNKTQIKKDIAVLHDLAEQLTQLSNSQLRDMEIANNLLDAINMAASMPHKGARKRQLKFITGLLRKIDIEAMVEKLACLENKSAHAIREHHELERWRDRLLVEGDTALGELLKDYPTADSQQLRHLIRNAKKELATEKPPKSSRLIYRLLKELLDEN